MGSLAILISKYLPPTTEAEFPRSPRWPSALPHSPGRHYANGAFGGAGAPRSPRDDPQWNRITKIFMYSRVAA